jgi:hypothetical protein
MKINYSLRLDLHGPCKFFKNILVIFPTALSHLSLALTTAALSFPHCRRRPLIPPPPPSPGAELQLSTGLSHIQSPCCLPASTRPRRRRPEQSSSSDVLPRDLLGLRRQPSAKPSAAPAAARLLRAPPPPIAASAALLPTSPLIRL